MSAISRAVATARAIADFCFAETVVRETDFFLAAVDEVATLRFAEVGRVVCAPAGTSPILTRPTTARLPIQKFDFLCTFGDPWL